MYTNLPEQIFGFKNVHKQITLALSRYCASCQALVVILRWFSFRDHILLFFIFIKYFAFLYLFGFFSAVKIVLKTANCNLLQFFCSQYFVRKKLFSKFQLLSHKVSIYFSYLDPWFFFLNENSWLEHIIKGEWIRIHSPLKKPRWYIS